MSTNDELVSINDPFNVYRQVVRLNCYQLAMLKAV